MADRPFAATPLAGPREAAEEAEHQAHRKREAMVDNPAGEWSDPLTGSKR